jgi:probable F420-dependent oxidoreductase
MGPYGPLRLIPGDGLVRLVGDIEAAGFESMWVGDHAMLPAAPQSPYPYSKSGTILPDTAMPDPLTWLAFVAGCSSRLRLGTGVLILPQRHPLTVAKECATIDALSGGRLILGVGVGWLREEAEALGVNFADRGRRMDEYIRALRVLWSEDTADFAGESVRFQGVKSYPKPTQPGGVPILVGGATPPAARRAGVLGDGFFPHSAGPDDLSHLIGEMRASARSAGRDADQVEITHRAGRTLDDCRRYADLGVSRLVLSVASTEPADVQRTLEMFVDRIVSRWPDREEVPT